MIFLGGGRNKKSDLQFITIKSSGVCDMLAYQATAGYRCWMYTALGGTTAF
jgi:hypothetical protein